jgi:flagellum-specific ATP synthase
MPEVAGELHRRNAERARALLTRYADFEWLRSLGEYEPGHDASVDAAFAHYPRLAEFISQDIRTPANWEDTLERLHAAVSVP